MIARFRFIEAGRDPALLALESDENAYRVRDQLTDGEYEILASHLAARPDAWLWLENGCTEIEVLRLFPGLRNLQVTSRRLESWSGIRHVADTLEHLVVGETTLKQPISIAPLGLATGLRSLYLIGPVADADAIARMTHMEDLTLRSVTLPDLSVLRPMHGLTRLRLLLGGTKDLRELPDLPALDDLELWRIRGLRDVGILGSLPRLTRLSLQAMSGITELPSLRDARGLRRLALDTMRAITDLRAVADAPALEELLLIAMNQLTPASLAPLIGHPTLRSGVWGLGSTRKNIAAYDLLPLGDPPFGHPRWVAPGPSGSSEQIG